MSGVSSVIHDVNLSTLPPNHGSQPDNSRIQPEEDRYNAHGDHTDSKNPLLSEVNASRSEAMHTALGREAVKPIIDPVDVAVIVLSVVCYTLGIVSICDLNVAWHLGYNGQLVVIGFLLSIMNTCLLQVAPTFFVHCEARFGRSTLQNFDAILCKKSLNSKTDWWWKAILMTMLALPIGLSAGYKSFPGGFSRMQISETHSLYDNTWGMYALPGMLPVGWNSGIALMFDAILPFLQTTSADPPIPEYPKAYGFNVLLLDDTSAALLDLPPPTWIKAVQGNLTLGESWTVDATVIGTVVRPNDTINAYRNKDYLTDNTFWKTYKDLGSLTLTLLHHSWNIAFLTNERVQRVPDSSYNFIGYVPEQNKTSTRIQQAQTWFPTQAKMFNRRREVCQGTWNISQQSVQLLDGRCGAGVQGVAVPEPSQLVFTNNTSLDLQGLYPQMFAELLGPYAPWQNIPESTAAWGNPTIATIVASMMWSRSAAKEDPGSVHWNATNSFDTLVYRSSKTDIFSTKPAVRSSAGLAILLAVLPSLTIAMCVAKHSVYSVPVGRDFGMVAILAGIERTSLDLLKGAGFSGKLIKPVHVDIRAKDSVVGKGTMMYSLAAPSDEGGSSRIEKGWVYS